MEYGIELGRLESDQQPQSLSMSDRSSGGAFGVAGWNSLSCFIYLVIKSTSTW